MRPADRWLGIALTIALLANVLVEFAQPRNAAADSFTQMKWEIEALVTQVVQRCTVSGPVHISSGQSGQLTNGRISC